MNMDQTEWFEKQMDIVKYKPEVYKNKIFKRHELDSSSDQPEERLFSS